MACRDHTCICCCGIKAVQSKPVSTSGGHCCNISAAMAQHIVSATIAWSSWFVCVCHTLSGHVSWGLQQWVPAECQITVWPALAWWQHSVLCVQSLCTSAPLSLARLEHYNAFGPGLWPPGLHGSSAAHSGCNDHVGTASGFTVMVVLSRQSLGPLLVFMAMPRHSCLHVLCQVG